MIWLLLVLACADDPTPPTATEQSEAEQKLEPLPPAQLIRRLSLDLRGVLPSASELDAIAADPAEWSAIREAYLADPRFEEQMVRLFAERWRTRVEVFDVVYQDFGLDPTEEFSFERSVGEEPLRLMARVAAEDRPWTDIVTARTTMANRMLADIWPVAYPDDATGWIQTTYTDSRPAAGVLMTNGLWWRYTTTNGNMNRGRAAAISRLLLCEDYLARPISLSQGGDGLGISADAIRSNPYCLSCHSSLDPIAASLFGFWWLAQYSEPEEITYHPEREPLGEVYLSTEMSWFGAPMSGLSDLGWHVGTDPRFTSCAVSSMAESLWRRPTTISDMTQLEDIRTDFIASDLRMKHLIRRLTDTEAYQAGRSDSETIRRLMSPAQLATALTELTGFEWTMSGYDQLDNDTVGYRVLGGGTDGRSVVRAQTEPGLTWLLVFKRAAQGAASRAVALDLFGTDRKLFSHVDLSHRPGDDAFTAELHALHWRLLATELDPDRQAELEELWSAVEVLEQGGRAWQTVLTVLMRDPAFVTY